MKTILIINYLIMLTCIYFIYRNELVWIERRKMIDWIYDQPDWMEKRRLLIDPSYLEMVLQFWKPVKSFYKEYLK